MTLAPLPSATRGSWARSYGKVFLAALPPMSVTRDEDETLKFLRRHAPARKLGHAAQPA